MYIWVVLATFLAILASYTLSPRADIRQLTVEPLAEAQIAQMVTQHKAAEDYTRYNKKPYRSRAEYLPGVVGEATLMAYMPWGHALKRHANNSLYYTTKIYCLTPDMKAAESDPDPCNVRKGVRVVVTYGLIPYRWVNKNAGLKGPNMDFMNAMRNTVDGGERFGYAVKTNNVSTDPDENPSGSNIRIYNRSSEEMYVPKAVADDMAGDCDFDDSGEDICLIYITPA